MIESFEPLRESGTVSDEMWGEKTLPKLLGLRGAVGTILFYEDPSHIEPFSGKFPMYKEHFAPWADHSNAMHQYFCAFFSSSVAYGRANEKKCGLVSRPLGSGLISNITIP